MTLNQQNIHKQYKTLNEIAEYLKDDIMDIIADTVTDSKDKRNIVTDLNMVFYLIAHFLILVIYYYYVDYFYFVHNATKE